MGSLTRQRASPQFFLSQKHTFDKIESLLHRVELATQVLNGGVRESSIGRSALKPLRESAGKSRNNREDPHYRNNCDDAYGWFHLSPTLCVATRSWEDVVNVPPRATVRIAWVPDDRPGSWMYHCHIVEHHASEMMGHFDVVS